MAGVYVPLISIPGKEAQVNFGYIGYLYDSKLSEQVKELGLLHGSILNVQDKVS